MPLYQYKCECGKEMEMFSPIALRRDKVLCTCGKEAGRLYGATPGYVDNWNPMIMSAERDMERGEKIHNKRLYREDQDHVGVNHLANRTEV
jgi:hypothetical protein